MRIAMMVRSYLPVPRPSSMIYAPIDLASEIARGLTKKGHDVDLYAPLGSHVDGVNVVTCNLRPLASSHEEFRELIEDPAKMTHHATALWDSYMVNEMFKRARVGRYDLLHFHHPEAALAMSQVYKRVPTVFTLHDPVYQWSKEIYEIFQTPNQYYISISDNQRRGAPDLPYLDTVYNGVNLKDYPFSENHEDYLLFAGRIVPDKGVKEAISVAKRTKHRLLIIGPVYPDSQGYFDQYVKPELDEGILYLGYIDRDNLPVYYQKAKAVLTPIQWEEPFGLTTIEAMASGTPVISFSRGAAPEIIENGKSGFVVDTTEEMIKAVRRIADIDRAECRKRVQNKFSTSRMVSNYEKAFEKVISRRRRLTRLLYRSPLHAATPKLKRN